MRIREHKTKNTTTAAAGLVGKNGSIALCEFSGNEQSETGAARACRIERFENTVGIG